MVIKHCVHLQNILQLSLMIRLINFVLIREFCFDCVNFGIKINKKQKSTMIILLRITKNENENILNHSMFLQLCMSFDMSLSISNKVFHHFWNHLTWIENFRGKFHMTFCLTFFSFNTLD